MPTHTDIIDKYLLSLATYLNEAVDKKEQKAANMIQKNSGSKIRGITKKSNIVFILDSPLDERELENANKIDDITKELGKMYKKAYVSFDGIRKFRVEEN